MALLFIYKIQKLKAQVDTDGKQGLFLHEQHANFHPKKYTGEASNKASDEDIMENDYTFVMLWNLSIINHWIFPQCLF